MLHFLKTYIDTESLIAFIANESLNISAFVVPNTIFLNVCRMAI